MTNLQIRVFQNTNGDGAQVHDERVVFVPVGRMQSAAGQAYKKLIEYSPSLTDTPGVYSYQSRSYGAGWLRLEGIGSYIVSRVDDLVRLSEIERAIGAKDPIPGIELGMAAPMAFHNRSPFVHILTGLAVLAFGGWIFSLLGSLKLDSLPKLIFIVALAIVVTGMGAWSMYMGLRRVKWWLRARQYARSDGGPIPDDLHYWG